MSRGFVERRDAAAALAGRVVVITGAANGIGAATARAVVASGASVALVDRDAAALQALSAELGSRASSHVLDVTDHHALQAMVAAVVGEHGGIDVVVANAGILGPTASISATEPEGFRQVIEVNLIGVWNTVHACLPAIGERRGHVLLVSSLAAGIATPTLAGYGAAKIGVEAIGRALRIELDGTGVTAGIAYFGLVDTELVRRGLGTGTPAYSVAGAMPRIAQPISAEQAATAVVDGIVRRTRRVVAPRWIWVVLDTRTLLAKFDGVLARRPSVRRAVQAANRPAAPAAEENQ